MICANPHGCVIRERCDSVCYMSKVLTTLAGAEAAVSAVEKHCVKFFIGATARCDRHGGNCPLTQLRKVDGLLLCDWCAKEGVNMLKDEDAEIAKVATHPRVTLADIEANIAEKHYAGGAAVTFDGYRLPADHPLHTFTICTLVLKNGFVICGTSAAADPRNFDAEMGKKIAYENALRQVWPLMGYALRQRLHEANTEADGR